MKRSLSIISLIFILMALIIGGNAVAYFTNEKDFEQSRFQTGEVIVAVSEGMDVSQSDSSFATERQVKWSIDNFGSTDVRLRVGVLDNWEGKEEEIILTPTESHWLEGGDGHYYYGGEEPLRPDESIDFNLDIKFDVWDKIDDYDVDIEVEAVQATKDAMDYMWPGHPL